MQYFTSDNEQNFSGPASEEMIFNILSQLNTDVIEDYIQRRLVYDDTALIYAIYHNVEKGNMQTYSLYYDKRLLGVVYYGFALARLNLKHNHALYIDVSKFPDTTPFFKAHFISAHTLN